MGSGPDGTALPKRWIQAEEVARVREELLRIGHELELRPGAPLARERSDRVGLAGASFPNAAHDDQVDALSQALSRMAAANTGVLPAAGRSRYADQRAALRRG